RFEQGGGAIPNLEHGILVKGLHAVGHGDAFEGGGLAPVVDGPGQFIVIAHEFVNPDAPLHAASAAGRASADSGANDGTLPTVERAGEDLRFVAFRNVFLPAACADPAHEALRTDDEQ